MNTNIIIHVIPIIGSAKFCNSILKPKSDIIRAVIVEPMFVPIMTHIEFVKLMMFRPTKLITIKLTTELLCSIAVVIVPDKIHFSGVAVRFCRIFFMYCHQTFFILI